MTSQERSDLIDECIKAVLSLRDEARNDPDDEEADALDSITGAACFRLMLLKDEHAQLREELKGLSK